MNTDYYVSVLIIDDESVTRFIHKSLIGFVNEKTMCYEATNGRDALNQLALLGKPLPDVMLIDLNMPLMDGFEFIETFQKLPDARNTILAVVSSSINPDDVDRCGVLGVDHMIMKPLMLPHMQTIISEAIARHHKMVA